ncbi:MAG: zinc ribbon domain-containing protein [Mobilitalea sp.]
MYCKNCGSDIGDSRFCPNCGKGNTEEPINDLAKDRIKIGKRSISDYIAVAFACVTIILFLISSWVDINYFSTVGKYTLVSLKKLLYDYYETGKFHIFGTAILVGTIICVFVQAVFIISVLVKKNKVVRIGAAIITLLFSTTFIVALLVEFKDGGVKPTIIPFIVIVMEAIGKIALYIKGISKAAVEE